MQLARQLVGKTKFKEIVENAGLDEDDVKKEGIDVRTKDTGASFGQGENLARELANKEKLQESSMSLAAKKGASKEKKEETPGAINKTAAFAGKDETPDGSNTMKRSDTRTSLNSEHEEFLHPNLKASVVRTTPAADLEGRSASDIQKEKKRKFNTCKSCFKRFDELILKPILIHNYDKILQNKRAEFVELFMGEGDVWEEVYANKDEEDKSFPRAGDAPPHKHTENTEAEGGEGSTSQRRASQIFRRITQISRRNSNFQGGFAVSMQQP